MLCGMTVNLVRLQTTIIFCLILKSSHNEYHGFEKHPITFILILLCLSFSPLRFIFRRIVLFAFHSILYNQFHRKKDSINIFVKRVFVFYLLISYDSFESKTKKKKMRKTDNYSHFFFLNIFT